jgi:hypothetical protein
MWISRLCGVIPNARVFTSGRRDLARSTREAQREIPRSASLRSPPAEAEGLPTTAPLGMTPPKRRSRFKLTTTKPAIRSQLLLRYGYHGSMYYILRFLWNATRGHHLTPWRSPYLLWRIETYTGVKMTQIGFLEFWEFMWRERHELWRFLKWTGSMERYAHPKPKSA